MGNTIKALALGMIILVLSNISYADDYMRKGRSAYSDRVINDLFYLKLGGGTMTGNIAMGNNDITGIDVLEGSTLNTGQGANELYGMNQNVLTSSNPIFSSVSSSTVETNVITTKQVYVQTGNSVTLDGSGGDTFIKYNTDSGKMEFWVDGVKRLEL